MLPTILTWDNQITKSIAFAIPHNVVFNYFFSFLSLKGDSIVIWAIIIFFLVLFEELKERRFIWFLLGSFLFAEILNNNILKNIFQRPRPLFHFAFLYHCPTDFSFPSGHAAGAFASAVILARFDPKRKWFYFVIAGLVALSRIYLGCHYLLDVIGGAVIGSGVSIIALYVYDAKYKTPKKKKKS